MTMLDPRTIPAAQRASALYCTIHGRGMPLLLIHGLGASGTIFQPLLAHLSDHFQVLIPDLRGHGQSRRLPGPDSADRLVSDVENLLNLLKIRSCVVLGHASGGAIAQQLALRCGSRVRGMALICSYARSASTIREQIESRLRPELFRLIGAGGVGALAARRAPSEGAAFVREAISTNDGRRVAPIARSLLSFDSRAWLSQIACPSLVVAGDADVTTPLHHARELAAGLRNAKLQVIPRAGHWLVKTHTPALIDIIVPWLRELEVAA